MPGAEGCKDMVSLRLQFEYIPGGRQGGARAYTPTKVAFLPCAHEWAVLGRS